VPSRALQNGISSAAAAACVLLVAASAQARTATLVPASGPAGTTTVLSGKGFSHGARVRVLVGNARAVRLRADRRGRFEQRLTIPKRGRASLRIVSGDRAARVVNLFRVRSPRQPVEGETASQNGARARWTPLAGSASGSWTLAVRGFPGKRRLRARFGPVALSAGVTSRSGTAVRHLTVPKLRPATYAVVVRAGARSLRFSFRVAPPGGAGTLPPGAIAIAPNILRSLIENVTAATGYRYNARDDQGTSLDTLKVISSPGGGYLGVYHALVGGVFVTKLATSTNLLTWTHAADLFVHGSQPTIAQLSDGSFLVAFEQDLGCTGTGPNGNCLAFRHYPSLSGLLGGVADRSFQAPRTLSKCAEGTPNIYAADLNPDIDHSTIDVGFHYFRNCDVDRQARGTLLNFSAWSAHVDSGLNAALEAFHPGGNIGDRDYLPLAGGAFNIHEVQFTKGDFGSWRAFLFDWTTGQAVQLGIHTHRGSSAFANPTFTGLLSPSGRPALLVTLFVPVQGAALNEGGELVYYREL